MQYLFIKKVFFHLQLSTYFDIIILYFGKKIAIQQLFCCQKSHFFSLSLRFLFYSSIIYPPTNISKKTRLTLVFFHFTLSNNSIFFILNSYSVSTPSLYNCESFSILSEISFSTVLFILIFRLL